MDPLPSGRIGDVHVGEVDGIRTVWAEAPGEFSGGIVVRVGHVDETLPSRGLTHMLEHLALFGLDRPGEHSNGHVDATTLTLHSSGTPEDVAQFLNRAARQLVDPPVARLADEKGVLRAEAAGRSQHPLNEITAWRWGAQTYGLEVTNELGVRAMTAEAVREWAATRIGRRNAVLWFTGPPPAGLDLALPEGEERPAPDPYRSPLPSFPAYLVSQAPGVIVHGLVRRSPAAVTAASVLRSRLLDDLRTSRAASYSPEVGYRPLTGGAAAVVAFADVVEGREDVVAERVPAALAEIIADGPTEQELSARRAEVRRGPEMPGFAGARVTSVAWDVLHGGRVQTMEEILADADQVTADQVATAAGDVRRDALLQIPVGVQLPPFPWVKAPDSLSPPVEPGRSFRFLGGDVRLVVAPEGVTVTGRELVLTVRRENIAALGRWEDGGRLLIGTDGIHLTVEPTIWRAGRKAVEIIDATVPDEVTVDLGTRPDESVPRISWGRRLRRLAGPGLEVLAVSLPAVGMVLVAVVGREDLVPVSIAVTMVAATAILVRRKRSQP